MKPIEEILKEVEEYEKLKAGANLPKVHVVSEYHYADNDNRYALRFTKDPRIGHFECLLADTLWNEASATLIAYAHNWSPETIIRELVEELKEALQFYADANNTIRDCMSEGLVCANVELSKVAIAALERLK